MRCKSVRTRLGNHDAGYRVDETVGLASVREPPGNEPPSESFDSDT